MGGGRPSAILTPSLKNNKGLKGNNQLFELCQKQADDWYRSFSSGGGGGGGGVVVGGGNL